MLASRLDDIMDLIDGTARRIQMFRAGEAPAGAGILADVIHRATEQLAIAVTRWRRTGTARCSRPASR